MKADLSPRLLAMVVVVALILVSLIGWFGLVSPQRSKSTTLDGQIVEARASLVAAKTLARPRTAGKGKATAFSALAAALPTTLLMPSILLQVQRLAVRSDVTLDSFTPSAPTALSGYQAIPIGVTVTGRYAAIQRFLHRLRVQAGSSGGRIHASGRLFAVESVGLAPGGLGLPQLSATISLDAFVYTGVVPTDSTTTTESAAATDSASATAAAGTP